MPDQSDRLREIKRILAEQERRREQRLGGGPRDLHALDAVMGVLSGSRPRLGAQLIIKSKSE